MNDVARTILAQLGGNKFAVMTGAKSFLSAPDGVSFRIGRNDARVNAVRVTLTPADDYTVEFIRERKGTSLPVATVEGVYCDNLQEVFTHHTGMATRLF